MKNIHPNSLRNPSTILKQLCQLIPPRLVDLIAIKHDIQKQARSFTVWSHVVAMLYAHLTHAIGLNDVCDALKNHAAKLLAIRNAKAPSRNTFSHANRTRPAAFIEDLFWQVLGALEKQVPGFGVNRKRKGLPRRFKRVIHVLDSSTIQLVASCMDWAKHRRQKAAAKLHLRISVWDLMPRYALVKSAKGHDNTPAREACAALREGEIVLFDKAYVCYVHLFELTQRGVYWVTRAKANMACKVVKRHLKKPEGNILRDDEVLLLSPSGRKAHPLRMRRVIARVEVDGKIKEMTFLSNNMTWAPRSVVDLYRARWSIEVFFKQLKLVLKLHGFLGHNANAVRWQIWTALLMYVLLRFLSQLGEWAHSFTRIFTVIRAVLWDRLDLVGLLKSYGTAPGQFEWQGAPQQDYLPGFEV